MTKLINVTEVDLDNLVLVKNKSDDEWHPEILLRGLNQDGVFTLGYECTRMHMHWQERMWKMCKPYNSSIQPDTLVEKMWLVKAGKVLPATPDEIIEV